MLEALMNIRRQDWPKLSSYLGPGPQTLIGYSAGAGFFGETTASDLVDGTTLANKVGLTVGTGQLPTESWLKFILDDKILFVAKRPLRYGLSWDSLNSIGIASGSRTIVIGSITYRVRLLRGLGRPVVSADVYGDDVSVGHESEWNRLMYRVCVHNPPSQSEPNFISYPFNELITGSGNGEDSWCLDTWDNATAVTRAKSNNIGYVNWRVKSDVRVASGWRPVLELIDPTTELYPLRGTHYVTDYVGAPKLNTIYFTDN